MPLLECYLSGFVRYKKYIGLYGIVVHKGEHISGFKDVDMQSLKYRYLPDRFVRLMSNYN